MPFACIVVTFNPPPNIFLRQLKALEEELVILVDNGSDTDAITKMQSWQLAAPERRYVIALGINKGIAAALNAGIRFAIEIECDFALLLDHDSVPSTGLPAALLTAALGRLVAGERLAAVGARIVDPRRQVEHGFYLMHRGIWRAKRCNSLNGSLLPCEFLNSSGSLIYLPAWEYIGEFDEDFFIDHVETDWYMRAHHANFKVYGLCHGELEHYLGDDIVRWWLFGWHSMPKRTPIRHYTIVRNSLWMYRRSYVPLAWKINNMAKLLFTLFYFSLFDIQRSTQLAEILRGFRDGLFHYPVGLRNIHK